MTTKEAYTTQEVASLLGITRQAVMLRAKTWESRKRAGRGGGHEWLIASMPEETRVAIRAAEEKKAMAACSSSEIVPLLSPSTSSAILDDRRRYKALAKADLVRQYLTWQRKFGATTTQKQEFIVAYTGGAWPKLLQELGPVSWKTLERWKLEQDRAGSVLALADKRGVAHKGRTLLSERHRVVILGHVLNPNGPNISQCVREVQNKCKAEGIFVPSEPNGSAGFVRSYMAECSTNGLCGEKERRRGTINAPYPFCATGLLLTLGTSLSLTDTHSTLRQ